MIARVALLLALLCLGGLRADAWLIGKSAYIGPGDITDVNFTAWWGLRGYNAAYAGPGVRLRRSKEILTVALFSGGNSGTPGTCTVTGTGGRGIKFQVCGEINGSGAFFKPIDPFACGVPDFVIIDSGAYTVDPSSLVAAPVSGCGLSGTTLTITLDNPAEQDIDVVNGTLSTGSADSYCTKQIGPPFGAPQQCVATKLYDQVAGNACGGASCDLVQTLFDEQALFVLSGPYLETPGDPGSELTSVNNFTSSANRLLSMATVAYKGSSEHSVRFLSSMGLASNSIGAGAAETDIWDLGANLNVTAVDAAWHAAVTISSGVGGPSLFNLDGTETAGSTGVSTSAGNPVVLHALGGGTVVMRFREAGFQDDANWSATPRTELCHNMRMYWGTGGTC